MPTYLLRMMLGSMESLSKLGSSTRRVEHYNSQQGTRKQKKYTENKVSQQGSLGSSGTSKLWCLVPDLLSQGAFSTGGSWFTRSTSFLVLEGYGSLISRRSSSALGLLQKVDNVVVPFAASIIQGGVHIAVANSHQGTTVHQDTSDLLMALPSRCAKKKNANHRWVGLEIGEGEGARSPWQRALKRSGGVHDKRESLSTSPPCRGVDPIPIG